MHALHAIEKTVGSDVQYKNYRSDGTILMLAAPAKGGVDGEAAAQSYLGRASWCLLLASVAVSYTHLRAHET